MSRLLPLWQARRLYLGAFALIEVFFAAFFWRALFTGKFFVASDAFIYSYPLRTLVWQQLREGKLPLWTPQIVGLSAAIDGPDRHRLSAYVVLPVFAGTLCRNDIRLCSYALFPSFIYCYLRK